MSLPSTSEYARAEDRLEGALSVEQYSILTAEWDRERIERPATKRADYFGVDMLRCLYHALVPKFENFLEEIKVEEMTKRRFLRRLEEFLDSFDIQQHPEGPRSALRGSGETTASMDVDDAATSAVPDPDNAPENDVQEKPTRRGQLVREEERKGLIEFRNVVNDGKRDSLIILTGCKNIYQKQLPKMPREYIARLVYDRNHGSMAIVKKGLRVVGGITYRIFPGRKFAEIVFCAITSTEQVKGYGSHLMNHLKDYVRKASDVVHFLTYADNYAIGYFKKQGFTTDITLDRSVWAGYIKDYEGGTIMLCTMLPKITYLRANDIVEEQKRVVYEKVQEISNQTHTAFPGIKPFPETGLRPKEVPGLVEAGWSPDMGKKIKQADPLYPLVRQLLSDIQGQTWAWPFAEVCVSQKYDAGRVFAQPVDPDQVPDYYNVIKEPTDLKTMEYRVETHFYKSLESFKSEFLRMMENCRVFNDPKSVYVKCANRLEAFFKTRLKAVEEYQTTLQQQKKEQQLVSST